MANMKTRVRIVAASLLTLMFSVAPVAAQTWPQRTVKFILPLGPGSGADIGARLIAEKLTARWGQPVVVENRPGGDGIVAINGFVSARDDHVILPARRRPSSRIPICPTSCPTTRAISRRSPALGRP